MIDLKQLRRIVETTPPGAMAAAVVSRNWLAQVELELLTGNAAVAELASIRAERDAQA